MQMARSRAQPIKWEYFWRLANQESVILPSLERKLRKNALCLNQSAISNFALYVIRTIKHFFATKNIKGYFEKTRQFILLRARAIPLPVAAATATAAAAAANKHHHLIESGSKKKGWVSNLGINKNRIGIKPLYEPQPFEPAILFSTTGQRFPKPNHATSAFPVTSDSGDVTSGYVTSGSGDDVTSGLTFDPYDVTNCARDFS